METNEKLKTALLQETEKAMLEMIEQLQTVREGDLQTLEQRVLTACISLGRSMMEQVLTHAGEEAERKARRDGECGHRQRLVGMRPKQLHTLMGKVTMKRAYYQCLTKEVLTPMYNWIWLTFGDARCSSHIDRSFYRKKKTCVEGSCKDESEASPCSPGGIRSNRY